MKQMGLGGRVQFKVCSEKEPSCRRFLRSVHGPEFIYKDIVGKDVDFKASFDSQRAHTALTSTKKTVDALEKILKELAMDLVGNAVMSDVKPVMLQAKGQINRAAVVQLLSNGGLTHPKRGKSLRGSLGQIITVVKNLKLESYFPVDTLQRAEAVLKMDSEGAARTRRRAARRSRTDKTSGNKAPRQPRPARKAGSKADFIVHG